MRPVRITTFICCLCLASFFGHAQKIFPISGTIEFEKNVNMYTLIRKSTVSDGNGFLQQAFEQYKKSQPAIKQSKSILYFSGDTSLYTPLPDTGSNTFFSELALALKDNITFCDLVTKTYVSQKDLFGEKVLVTDSLPKIRWKITDEVREIAGYNCRRANAIILDSIYVVAFYTSDIHFSGGPLSFTGLPGMILGIALPHENMNWFATKVTYDNLPAAPLTSPVKGKRVNRSELTKLLAEILKARGVNSLPAIRSYLL